MIRITGKTFPHRDDLKSMGCRWHDEFKCWVVARLPHSQRRLIQSWPGVTLTDVAPTPPTLPPLTIEEQTRKLLKRYK